MNNFDKLYRESRQRTVYAPPDLDAQIIDSPHYTDSRFDKEQTVFGKEQKGLHYNYSDRLWQWDYDKSELAAKKTNDAGVALHTARWYQTYLSFYFDKTIELKHIVAGVNQSNGYPYLVFGYKEVNNE